MYGHILANMGANVKLPPKKGSVRPSTGPCEGVRLENGAEAFETL